MKVLQIGRDTVRAMRTFLALLMGSAINPRQEAYTKRRRKRRIQTLKCSHFTLGRKTIFTLSVCVPAFNRVVVFVSDSITQPVER